MRMLRWLVENLMKIVHFVQKRQQTSIFYSASVDLWTFLLSPQNSIFETFFDIFLSAMEIELLPSALRQNLDKNQNLDKQINSNNFLLSANFCTKSADFNNVNNQSDFEDWKFPKNPPKIKIK